MRTGMSALLLLLFAISSGAQAPIRSHFAPVRGIELHYLEAGNTAAHRALVLIPGWRLPAYLWTEQLHDFGRHMRVIAVDPRSQGRSTKTPLGNTPEARARDYHALLARLGIVHCVLVGWSQGAQDVAAYVQQFGAAAVDGIVLVDSPVNAGPAEVTLDPEFARIILATVAQDARHPRQVAADEVRGIFAKPHPSLNRQSLVNFALQTPVDTGIAMLVDDIFGADRRPALARFPKPALVIAHATSRLLAAQQRMAASMPHATFVSVSGAGHAVFVDRPHVFDAALARFLSRLAYGSAHEPRRNGETP